MTNAVYFPLRVEVRSPADESMQCDVEVRDAYNALIAKGRLPVDFLEKLKTPGYLTSAVCEPTPWITGARRVRETP